MKKLTLIIGTLLLLSSCNTILAWLTFKPTDTWYFKEGFDKKAQNTALNFQIADSTNISSSAIRLVRKKNDSIYCYWVDIDELSYNGKNERIYIRIKIVGAGGQIKRFLGGWFDIDSSENYNLNDYKIIEKRNGDVVFSLNEKEYHLRHLGDEMGIHHSEIKRPINIPKEASFSAIFEGYDYNYSWIVLKNIDNGFLRFYKYSTEGVLLDSIFVISNLKNIEELKSNYFFDYSYSITLHNGGEKTDLVIEQNPFQGYGKDEALPLVNLGLQSLSKENYVDNIFADLFRKNGNSFLKYRNPEALKMLNNTIKSIGYDKFLSKEEFTSPKIRIGHFGVDLIKEVSVSTLLDSLLYYSNKPKEKRYYYEFWERREAEGTKLTTILILKDIKQYYEEGVNNVNIKKINNTLKECINYDLRFQNADSIQKKEILKSYFDYLNSINLDLSAYNLIFNTKETKTVEIDRVEILKGLNIDKKSYWIEGERKFLNLNKPSWIQ